VGSSSLLRAWLLPPIYRELSLVGEDWKWMEQEWRRMMMMMMMGQDWEVTWSAVLATAPISVVPAASEMKIGEVRRWDVDDISS
jgi:hypothetical protein